MESIPKPKKPLSTYLSFVKHIKSERNVSIPDVSVMWNELKSDPSRKKELEYFNQLSVKDYERYNRELAEYNEKVKNDAGNPSKELERLRSMEADIQQKIKILEIKIGSQKRESETYSDRDSHRERGDRERDNQNRDSHRERVDRERENQNRDSHRERGDRERENQNRDSHRERGDRENQNRDSHRERSDRERDIQNRDSHRENRENQCKKEIDMNALLKKIQSEKNSKPKQNSKKYYSESDSDEDF